MACGKKERKKKHSILNRHEMREIGLKSSCKIFQQFNEQFSALQHSLVVRKISGENNF